MRGEVKTLMLFKFPSLQHLQIPLYDGVFKQDRENLTSEALPSATESLFAQNGSSVKQLTLECSETATGGETHLNSILKTLCIHSEKTSETSLGEGEVEKSVLQDEETVSTGQTKIFLPVLFELTIVDPVKLDEKLLKQLIQERRDIAGEFSVKVKDSKLGKEVLFEDWEARGWME